MLRRNMKTSKCLLKCGKAGLQCSDAGEGTTPGSTLRQARHLNVAGAVQKDVTRFTPGEISDRSPDERSL
jgi:hypothetical protein